jgi:hypothetical protein
MLWPTRFHPRRTIPLLGLASQIVIAVLTGAQTCAAESAIDRFHIVSQQWHRYSGLAVVDIIFRNENQHPVNEPVIACEFLTPRGELIGSRGTMIHRMFRPGKHAVRGVHFSMREKDAVPGACRVLSVKISPSPQ